MARGKGPAEGDDGAPLSGRARVVGIALLLALAVAAVFGRAEGFGFIELDDRSYVVDNAQVNTGLSIANARWAFTTFRQANWHPLTWLSLQADASMGGGGARTFHVTNVWLHAAATVLLFLALHAMTGCPWRSAAVALLFGVHPLRAESVVWIAERKDVLSQAFAFASLYAWAGWVRKPVAARYAAAAGLFAAGLLAKPMLVTLPVLMLLLDRWPFDRFDPVRGVREKLPLFALAAASAVVTFVAQSSEGAVGDLTTFPLPTRLANACVVAVDYLVLTLWPAGLANPYPYDLARLTPARVLVCAIVLAAITALAVRAWRSRPHLAVGWAWYLVTLLPVIGLVQVGSQARADRYTYLPMIGPVIALVWELGDRIGALPRRRARISAAVLLASAAVPAGWVAVSQVSLWKNTETLFRHTIAVTSPNAVAHHALGLTLFRQGRHDEAVAELRTALGISERYPEAWTALGESLLAAGQVDEAVSAYERAVDLGAADPAIRTKLVAGLNAVAMRRLKAGDTAGAERVLRQAIAAAPSDATSHASLGVLLARTGRLDEAEREFAEAVRLDPGSEGFRSNLERIRRMRR
jgi:tetratricopeptide (TPR) repeat protein